jgi:hypothetical protein
MSSPGGRPSRMCGADGLYRVWARRCLYAAEAPPDVAHQRSCLSVVQEVSVWRHVQVVHGAIDVDGTANPMQHDLCQPLLRSDHPGRAVQRRILAPRSARVYMAARAEILEEDSAVIDGRHTGRLLLTSRASETTNHTSGHPHGSHSGHRLRSSRPASAIVPIRGSRSPLSDPSDLDQW